MARFEYRIADRVPRARKLRVLLVGMGPIGVAVGRALAERPDRTIVGAVDPSPLLRGKKLAERMGGKVSSRLAVAASLNAVSTRADVAVHATGSVLAREVPLLESLLHRGLHVVSTCESLFDPEPSARRWVTRLDRAARKAGKVVTAGGVNPGFAMDILPLTLASAMTRVDSVEVRRVLDAGRRRLSFQRKVCVGESPTRVRSLIREGMVGHVGLVDSARFLCRRLGWPVERAVRTLRPVVAKTRIPGPIPVQAGQVAGLEETVRVYEGKRLRAFFFMHMAAGARSPEDRVRLQGSSQLESVVSGGINGDVGTVGEIVNLVGRAVQAEPGLRSAADLGLSQFPRLA